MEKDIEVRNLLKSGKRLEATNLYHARYGGEFSEVRAIIEEMETDDAITGYYSTMHRQMRIKDPIFRETIDTLLRKSDLIAAVKLCREQDHSMYPSSLKDAKQAVLAWQNELDMDLLPAEPVAKEPPTPFDIRWHSHLHKKRPLLFWKQPDIFVKIRFELQIANRTITDMVDYGAVDWEQLAASARNDGDFGIFTCSCGYMGCGGYQNVEVVHLAGKTLWFEQGSWFIFEEAAYKAAILRFEEAIQRVREENPGVPIKFELE